MKKIAVILLIIVLAVIVCVQYAKLSRLSPPEAFEYTFREDVDLDYHNPAVLGDYYETGYAVGSYAREMWRNNGINVRIPESDNADDRRAAIHYNHLRAYTDSLGARLSRSLRMKKEGWNNVDIQAIESEGISPKALRIRKVFGKQSLVSGDKSRGVFVLQAFLIRKGYQIPHDGYYWTETEEAVRDYQNKNGLPGAGFATEKLLLHIIANKEK
ncbi:MAG TPA: peptidoglycan-binding protein [Bacteroidetes bacterium]|nr:peptidoglycan-binding protein [Bacteroidota bacterium]